MMLGVRSRRNWLSALCLLASLASAFQVQGAGCSSAPSGLVSWWPADGTANDIAGSNHGTLQSGATANAVGVVGSAFTFDGTNAYVQIPDSPALRPTNLTIEAWVRFAALTSPGNTTDTNQQYIVFKQNSRSGNFEGYDLGTAGIGGQVFLAFRVSSAAGVGVKVLSINPVTTNTWYHVAGVRGTNFIQLYLDGQLQGQTNVSFAQDYGSYPLYFGSSGQTYWNRKFKGTLDEVSLYNRVLSANEIAAIYAAGAAGKCKAPDITAQPQDRAVVRGGSAVFTVVATGFGTLHYQWRLNGVGIAEATGAALTLANVQPTDAGSYTVVVTNALGSVTSSVATLTVWVPPAISVPPQSRTNLAGTDAAFSVTASGTPPLAYQWQFNNAAIPGATGSGLVRSTVSFADAGEYRVVVTNAGGAVTSAVAVLTVLCPLVTLSPPTLPGGTAGNAYSQSLVASGGAAPYTYAVISGALPAGLGLSGGGVLSGTLLAVGTFDFSIRATDANGCSGSRGFTLAVKVPAIPPEVTVPPASLMVLAGENASFSVAVSGTEPLSYQWRFNGTNLADGGQYGGVAAGTLVVSNVEPANAGSYAVVISNVAGSTSAWATLAVVPPAACVSAAEGLVGWWPGDGDANDLTGSNPGTLQGGATANAPGMVGSAFTFDGTNGYVQIPDDPDLRPAQLTIETWVRFDSLDSLAWGGSPAGDQYLVFKKNANGSNFEGFALTKTRVGGLDVFEFEVSTGSSQSAQVKSVSMIATGVWYHVVAVRGSNYLQLHVNGQLERQTNVSFAQDYGNYPLYFGSSGQPTLDHRLAGALDEVSLYNRALSASQIAAIYAAGAAGKCKALTITGQPQSRAGLLGSNVTFTVTAVGSQPLVYQWQRDGVNLSDGGNISGAFSPALSLANVTFDDTASYQVIITNSVSTATSAVAVLTVESALVPPTITDQPVSQTAAVGTSVTFTVGVSGTAPFGYQWRLNGTNLANSAALSGVTSPTLVINSVLPADAGAYSLVVTNDLQAVTSAVALLTVIVPTECLTPPAGLVGWWPGDGSARDLVGTNNGTLEDGATADAPAVVGHGFSLDGTNKYVRIPDSPVLKPAELTVECWVKWNNLDTPGTSVYPGQQYIVFKQNSRSSDFEAYVLSKDRTWNDIILWEVTSASGQLVRIDSTSPVTTNVWYHLAGVRGSNYIQIYFNGQLEAETTVDFPQNYGNWPLYFGTSGQSYYDRKLNGVIDEVALYNRALSAQEIATLYASGAAGKCKGTNGIVITAQPQNQVAAPGSNVSFTVTATGVEPMTYQWLFNGNPVTGATTSTLALTNVQASNAGSYKVTITNPTGTKNSADAMLMVSTSLLLYPRTTPEGLFAFTLSGTPGLAYIIEVTTNLQQWVFLASLTNTTGLADFTDNSSSNSPSRFYRARPAN